MWRIAPRFDRSQYRGHASRGNAWNQWLARHCGLLLCVGRHSVIAGNPALFQNRNCQCLSKSSHRSSWVKERARSRVCAHNQGIAAINEAVSVDVGTEVSRICCLTRAAAGLQASPSDKRSPLVSPTSTPICTPTSPVLVPLFTPSNVTVRFCALVTPVRLTVTRSRSAAAAAAH